MFCNVVLIVSYLVLQWLRVVVLTRMDVSVRYLILAVPYVGLLSIIVTLSGHTYCRANQE